jgi:hypothetical protein
MKTIALPFICFLLTSCQSNEIANSKDVNPAAIYTSYNISYSEGDENVSCRASFRFGGSNGTTLVLNSPTKVQLDGQTIKVDSSRFSGAYYQVGKSFSSFKGEHVFTFFNANNSTMKEAFTFRPFALAKSIPASVSKKGFSLSFNDLDNNSKIKISISDTSAQTNDINREFSIQNNEAAIFSDELKLLKNGPLEINISMFSKKALQQSTPEGGEIIMSYSLNVRKTNLKN